MHDDTIEDSAWAWYDPESGDVKHVSMIKDHAHPEGTQQIEIDLQSATDILTGVSKLIHYTVRTHSDGTVSFRYIAASMLDLALKFSKLTECIPWDKKWQDEDAFDSPIRIIKQEYGMDIYVVAYTVNATVYITLGNEPSWLIKTVDLKNAMTTYGLGPIPVELDQRYQYTAYVRYHAA